ncbi:MAG: hypothetical protein M1827_006778 [Pycnora praestabilis]|nr:MAG: hypothetical protein M1827_006778 [Pycnora praestabilis]
MARAEHPPTRLVDPPVARVGREKGNALVPQEYEDDRSSTSSDGAQAGVKRIEAVSSTRANWALIMAYTGSDK